MNPAVSLLLPQLSPLRQRSLAAVALLGALCLAGCSSPATRVVLLPQEDGSASSVVVRTRHGEQTLAQPYQRATSRDASTGSPTLDKADPAQLQRENPALFELVPPKVLRYTLYFNAGDSTLTPASQQALAELIGMAKSRPGADLVVTGHTDTRGSLLYNDNLSLRRAMQVRQMLVERQFPAGRIEAVGRGERELIVPTPDETDEPRNRRVTIEVR